MSHKPLSINDFKNWLSEEQDLSQFFNIGMEPEDPTQKYVGRAVKSKVGQSKLLERIVTDDDENALVEEFIEDGGTVLAMEGRNIQIEVESGEFSVPRFCVKIKNDE